MKKSTAIILAAILAASTSSCGKDETVWGEPEITPNPQSEGTESGGETSSAQKPESPEIPEEPPTEEVTEHVSPVETVTASLGIQQTVNKTVPREENHNTVKFPLADFMEEGDRVSSFTFVIYSGDGSNIGTFEGGFGISVEDDCSSATDDGWYQSPKMTAATQGTYGEITWEVPSDVAEHIHANGEVLFGYWWGGAGSVRVSEVICNLTRTRDIPCDGTVGQEVGSSVNFNDSDNTIRIKTDFLPEGAVPQAVTYNVSSGGGFGKLTGAFGYNSSLGEYQSKDFAVFTGGSSATLTWIVDAQARSRAAADGELVLGYWWSEQSVLNLDSVTVKYSLGDTTPAVTNAADRADEAADIAEESGFRTPAELVKDMKVGWNLGNTLECYNTEKTGLDTETGWGNPRASEELVKSVKNAGFNAIRIPVTWGEHMDGDTIQTAWLDRVQTVVDYAYNNDMYVIMNAHHDDYIWLDPLESEYSSDSARLKAIWAQVAERFKDYGDRLIFEGTNETRNIGSKDEWMGGTAAERAVVNRYQQDFVNTVRASGGNNKSRALIVTAYGACAEDVAMNDLIVPNDKNLIVSFHYYAPWKFSGGESTTFGDAEKSELSAKFDKMKSMFIDKGQPLIIDEFGCVGVADDSVRAEYYSYYLSAAKARGIKCFVWDNNVKSGKDGYGLVNRTNLEWNETLLGGVMNGVN